ncbi:MAG: S-layer homology domain-containing protein [Clostridia bacterium]|nr:S-layer homology domain-containing protein [Clostridia bacterium]
MLKRVISLISACAVALTAMPVFAQSTRIADYGFEANEAEWDLLASNGRTAASYDNYKAHTGDRSYKFEAVTAYDADDVSKISKTIDADTKGAYKVGIWYMLSAEYERLDGADGGALFEYTLIDKRGAEVNGGSYVYYFPQNTDSEDIYSEEWRGQDFYILPTTDTAKIRISVGLKTATGQVNFDDITVDKIDRTSALSNPVTKPQNNDPLIRDSYTYGWEAEDGDYWDLSLGKNSVAQCGATDTEAHSGARSYMFKADTLNVTAENNQQIINKKYHGSYFRVKPGVYDVSWWYKITGPYKRASNSWGMSVNIIVYTDDGKTQTGNISKTYLDSDADKGWQQTHMSITVPDGSSFIRLNIGLRASTGGFYVDDLAITPLMSDFVSQPDLENYNGMTVKKLDKDSVYVNINTDEAQKDDVLDYVILGDEASEKAHNTDTGKSVAGYGGLGDTYRQIYPGDDKILVTMKVDPKRMNYITVKLWGSESENKEIKNLMINDEYGTIQAKYGTVWPVWDNMYEEPAQRESYFYATYRLPMAMTYGKNEVRFVIYHGGDANAYSANGMNTAMEYSRQLYKLVTHTDPRYKKMADDKDGTTKRYDLGKIKVSPNGLSPYDYIINEMNAGIEAIFKSQNYGPEWDAAVEAGRSPAGAYGAVLEGTNTMSHGTWENWKKVHYAKCLGSNTENQKGIRAMAMAYNREWSNHYHDEEIIDRCVAWLDYQVRSQGSNGGWDNETYKTWIGGPDRMPATGGISAGSRAVGEVFMEVGDRIIADGYLDKYFDDDLNPNTPEVLRRDAYANMYDKATDYMLNVIQRKPAVNQELFNVVSAVAFQMALKKIAPNRCLSDEALKKRMYEATGIMRTPRESILISPKGLSMETIGHFDGAYDGNYGPHGAAMVADLALMTGDSELKKKAIMASNAMNYFADTVINHKGYNAIRREFNINTRNYKGPGRIEYAAWNNFIAAGFGSKDSVRSMELFVEYGELYLSSLVSDRRLLFYMIQNFDAMGEEIKKASEGYKTFADIKDIPQEAAIVTLAWRGIIEGINDTNFAPDRKIDEATFKRWLNNAFGNDYQIKYTSVMSRAQAAYEIYYELLDNGVYITKFDLGSGIYMPNEPWNKDENGNQKEYVFSDEVAQSLSFQHKNEFVRMTLNWRNTISSFYYADNHREHAIYSQVFRWHEMNDKWSAHGNGYMTSPLGLRRINIAKYGNYIILMNCSDQNLSTDVELNANVSKIHDLVSDTMLDVNQKITMKPLTTIILDVREVQ